MCERIRLRLYDKDKPGNDDVIGTTFISMSQISPDGDDRFLTFGPCFVNLYGSPREFTHFPDKYGYLNMGMVSNCGLMAVFSEMNSLSVTVRLKEWHIVVGSW